MSKRDKRVDECISKAQPFARPILTRLRKMIHDANPELEETIKWSMPAFTWQGRLVCNMAAFKQHCALNIWRASEITEDSDAGAMGQFGRITTLQELPSADAVHCLIRKRIATYAEGKAPRTRKTSRPPARIPSDLGKALDLNEAARRNFEAFSASHRREYIEWITDAKREATRQKRLATTIEWLAEGKPRNWKYM